jgi:hypothetical protein
MAVWIVITYRFWRITLASARSLSMGMALFDVYPTISLERWINRQVGLSDEAGRPRYGALEN